MLPRPLAASHSPSLAASAEAAQHRRWSSSSASILRPSKTKTNLHSSSSNAFPSPPHKAARFRGGSHHLYSSQLCNAERGDGSGGAASDASVTVSIGNVDAAAKKTGNAGAKNDLTSDLNLNLKLKRKDSQKVSEDDLFSIDPDVESRLVALCDSGMPDAEVRDMARAVAPREADFLKADGGSVAAEAFARGRWLLGLLMVQSTSSLVLDAYGGLLRDHIVVTLFLTMLVGAGGNAGNQSAIHVIRGLATGSLNAENSDDFAKTMLHQGSVGALLASGLALAGFARVLLSTGSVVDSTAISASLFLIVLTSVGVGSALPFALARLGVDPANAGTSVQVAMDILGCFLTCATCSLVLGRFAEAVAAVS